MTRALAGLKEVIDQYDGLILDQFGVLHNGENIYPDILKALEQCKVLGKKVVIVSNSPWLSGPAKENLNHKYGISSDLYNGLITAGDMALMSLKQIDYGRSVWLIGDDPLSSVIADLTLVRAHGPEDADFILNCIPGTEPGDHSQLRGQLKLALKRGLTMICANPDLSVNIGNQSFVCAGAYAKYYQDKGGKVLYFGKPHPGIYVQAWQAMADIDRKRILAVGDSLHTDIGGAQGFGIDSLMTLCGIHWEEIRMDHASEKLDMIRLQNLLELSSHKPTYFMRELSW